MLHTLCDDICGLNVSTVSFTLQLNYQLWDACARWCWWW